MTRWQDCWTYDCWTWGPSGAYMRRVPLGLGRVPGGGVGERQKGVKVADSLVGIHLHPRPARR